jgi:DNA invertase Pin-like site-specific DNA recombinase
MADRDRPITAGIYLRVSTEGQTIETQRPDLERLAAARGWDPVWYEDVASGVKDRPALRRLVEDARLGKVTVVAVWAIDRLGRSMREVVKIIGDLDGYNVPLVSVRENWIEVSGPTRPLLISIMSWVAEMERARLVERTRAGMDQARRAGKRFGRRPTSPILLHAAADLVAQGVSIRTAATKKGVSKSALGRFLREGCHQANGQRSASREGLLARPDPDRP